MVMETLYKFKMGPLLLDPEDYMLSVNILENLYFDNLYYYLAAAELCVYTNS